MGEGELPVQRHHRRNRAGRRIAHRRRQSAARGGRAQRAHPQALAHGRLSDRLDRRARRSHLSLRLSRRRAADARGSGDGGARVRFRAQEGRAPSGDRRHERAGAAGRRGHRCARGACRASGRRRRLEWLFGPAYGGSAGRRPRRRFRARRRRPQRRADGGARCARPPFPARCRRDRHRPRGLRCLYRHPRRRGRAPRRRHPSGRGLPREVRHLRQHRGARADGWARLLPPGRRARGLGDPARAVGRARPQASLRLACTVASGAVQGASPPATPRSDRARRAGGYHCAGRARRRSRKSRVWPCARRLLFHQSDRAGVRRHGGMLADRRGPRRAHRGGIAAMAELWTNYIWPLVIILAQSVLLLVVLLIITAYVLYADRKIWAAVQIRRGPNVVGPWGLLQSFADLFKFVVKEPIIPAGANKGVFLLAPLVTGVLALSAWAVIPVSAEWEIANLNVGVLYIFAISSLMVYGVIMAGWSSNSKYPFLASLRSAAQMVSYDVSIGFVMITVLLCAGSLNLSAIVEAQDGSWGMFNWFWLPLLPMFVVFLISALAETNRPPFDLVEAESELVAGYAVEYSATPFLLFFLGEYVAMLTMCAMATILFLGGWLPPFPVAPFTWIPGVIWFALKVLFMFFLFAMVKAIVPRYRYDQLMRLGWKVFLPLSLAMVAIVAGVLQYGGFLAK